MLPFCFLGNLRFMHNLLECILKDLSTQKDPFKYSKFCSPFLLNYLLRAKKISFTNYYAVPKSLFTSVMLKERP